MPTAKKIFEIRYLKYGKQYYCYSSTMETFYESYTDCRDEAKPMVLPDNKLATALRNHLTKIT
jgi:hypothetical protein